MTSPINVKFYPLQHEERDRACKPLKFAEIRVLYHLRTLLLRSRCAIANSCLSFDVSIGFEVAGVEA